MRQACNSTTILKFIIKVIKFIKKFITFLNEFYKNVIALYFCVFVWNNNHHCQKIVYSQLQVAYVILYYMC